MDTRLPNRTNLKIFTSNVNTCRDLKTRAGILDILRGYKPDVWLLQEVNVSTEELNSLVANLGFIASCNVTTEEDTIRRTAIIVYSWKIFTL